MMSTTTASPSAKSTKRLNIQLWIVQALLAAIFLFASVMKFVMPADQMAAQSHLPVGFIHFIGVCEMLGALGLILPGLLHIRPGLTPLAAAGLVIIMIGATVVTVVQQGAAPAIAPFVVGLLAAFVAYGRWKRVPLRGSAPPAVVAEAR